MRKKPAIGHMLCPECDFPDAEILADKNGDPYRYCSDCHAQYFSRGTEHRVKNLLARMRPVAPSAAPAEKPLTPPTAALPGPPASVPVIRRIGVLLDEAA